MTEWLNKKYLKNYTHFATGLYGGEREYKFSFWYVF